MQKQTIYSYLQRSLVKILSKSSYSNEYKTTLVKPLNTCWTGIASYAKPMKNSIKLIPLPTEVALQSQTLNFFRKVNTSFKPFLGALGQLGHQPSLRFSCKFNLISFKRPRFGVLILKCDKNLLFNFAKLKKNQATKQKLIKLNQSLNNDQLFYYFRAKLLGTHFCQKILCCNKNLVACSSCPFFIRCCYYSTCPALSSKSGCPSFRSSFCVLRKKSNPKDNLQDNPKGDTPYPYPTGPWVGWCLSSKKSKKGTYFRQSIGIERLAQRAYRSREAVKIEALLFANPFDQRLCKVPSNLDFYIKQSKLLFCQDFYKTKQKAKDYRKTFINLFYFFSFFSFTINKEVNFFNSAELAAAKQVSFTRYAQQVLYLDKISGVTCSVQLLCFTSINLEFLEPLYFLRNKIIITRGCPKVGLISKSQQIECFSFTLLCFLTLIFYVAIKYIKQFKKQVDDPFQPVLVKNNSIYQCNKIIYFNFISFKPFFHKLVGALPLLPLPIGHGHGIDPRATRGSSAFNSHYFFLMRPLFSLTRLDTFFICESLKLPIYPDKSNLRVDFLRNRIRKQILPAIRILLNPQFDTILCRFYE